MPRDADVHPLHPPRAPPARSVPVAKLRVSGDGLQRYELQTPQLPVPLSPVLAGGPHVLPLIWTWAGGVLHYVPSASGVQHPVVPVYIPGLLPSSLGVGGIVAYGPVLLVAAVTRAPVSPVHHAVLGGEVVAGHEALAGEGVVDDLQGAVPAGEVCVAVRDGDSLPLPAGDQPGAPPPSPAVRPALHLDRLALLRGRLAPAGGAVLGRALRQDDDGRRRSASATAGATAHLLNSFYGGRLLRDVLVR